jgi:phosphate transport system substrate-binding protein
MTRDQRPDDVSRRKFILATGAAGTAALAGCTSGDGSGGSDGGDGGSGGDGESGSNNDGSSGSGGEEDTETSSEELSGDIRISGSSTVYPVAQEVTRQFAEQNPDVSFNLTRDGSGGGFENVFIPGDSDMNNASRPIGEDELQRCRDNGIEPVEFFLAQDALTVVVNNEADFIDSISLEDLGTIWSPDAAPETWADVNSDWPDEPFDLYGPASTSGTYDYFTETVIGETEADQPIRSDFEGTEEDDLIAQGVAGNEYALGYLPFAYYVNNPDTVKALSLSEGGSDPVEPSLEGAKSGNYPLARPLFTYGHMGKIQEKNHLQAFIEYYINEADEDYVAEDIGYVPASDQMVEDNLTALEEAIAGEYSA